MITIFQATHRIIVKDEFPQLVRSELYSNKEAADLAVSQWVMQAWTFGQRWEWSIDNNRYEFMMNGAQHIMVVEEQVVHNGVDDVATHVVTTIGPIIIDNTPRTFRMEPVIDHGRGECAHDNCPECQGTGQKKRGGPCVHHLVCHCPRCSPQCSVDTGFFSMAPQLKDSQLLSWQIVRNKTSSGSV